MSDLTAEKLAIRETVENWVIYCDAGDCDRLALGWLDDRYLVPGPRYGFYRSKPQIIRSGRQHPAHA